MATLTIRNLDEAVVRRLKQRAQAHNRSLAAEVREILTIAAYEPADKRRVWTQAGRIVAMTPDVPQTNSTNLIRRDRDR